MVILNSLALSQLSKTKRHGHGSGRDILRASNYLLQYLKLTFLREMVIAVLLGYQTNNRAEIEITSIESIWSSNAKNVMIPPLPTCLRGIKVMVKEKMQGGNLPVITNPYHFIRVKRAFSVIFEHEQAEFQCRDNSECLETEYCKKDTGNCGGFGMCKTKPSVCPELYEPVCGCDLKTYSNACEAEVAGVSILHYGECKVISGCIENQECGLRRFCLFPEGKCSGPGMCNIKPSARPLYYAPVCGCDMKTYGNECDAYANGVSILHKGECKEVTE